jgi:hypothetical protein
MGSTLPGVSRRVTVTAITGFGAGMYVDWFDNGVHQESIAFESSGELIGTILEASSLHWSRLVINDVTPYTISFIVEEL